MFSNVSEEEVRAYNQRDKEEHATIRGAWYNLARLPWRRRYSVGKCYSQSCAAEHNEHRYDFPPGCPKHLATKMFQTKTSASELVTIVALAVRDEINQAARYKKYLAEYPFPPKDKLRMV